MRGVGLMAPRGLLTAIPHSNKHLLSLMLPLPQLARSADPYTVGVKQVLYDVSKPRKRRLGQFKKCILFVLEICSGGELFSYLETCGRFEEVLARTYFRQIMEALSFVRACEEAS